MKRIYRLILSSIIVLALFIGLLPPTSMVAHAATTITDPSGVNGSTYSSTYAAKLDNIFKGNVNLFSNTTAKFPLGSRLDNSKQYYVASAISGWQCYIYAQGVYYYLFGDLPYHGDGYKYWSNSKKVLSNQSSASYDSFRNAGVGFGAYIRTTTNSDGSYNGSGGHSMIVLSYDSTGITYLEGNADGNGLVRISINTWSEFNQKQVTGRSRKISHIVQCNAVGGGGNSCSCSTSYAGNYTCTTTSSNLLIRSGHGTSYSSIGSIPPGATVYVSKASGTGSNDWAHVEYNGISGYASMQYLTKQQETQERDSRIGLWLSDSEMGGSIDTIRTGEWLYLCYKLYDANTGDLLDTYNTRGGYTAKLTLYEIDGSVAHTYTFTNDNNWISIRRPTPGTYKGELVFTWNSGGTATSTVSIYMVYEPRVTPSASDIQLNVTGTNSQTISISYSGATYSNSIYLDCTTSGDCFTYEWGSWSDHKMPLTITGVRAGQGIITIEMYDSDTDEIIATSKVYVTVTAPTYTVSYNANGGSDAPGSQIKYYNTTLTLSTTKPTRFGYTFLGWSTSSTATSATYQPGGSFTSNADTTLYAVWKLNTSALSLNSTNNAVVSTGGEVKYFTFTPNVSGKYVIYSTGSDDTRVYLYNASGTELDSDDDDGAGNNFRLECNLTAGTKYIFGVKYYNSSKTGTISFKFGEIFTINYNANGGTGAPPSQSKDYGTDITLSSTRPTRSGYTFLGWSTSSSATSATYQPGGSFTSNANTTLYAVWKKGCENNSHNYSYSVTKAPTSATAGTLTGTCSKCSGTTTVTLPKLNTSDYTYKVVTAATCTADGTGRYTWKTTTYGTFYFDVTISKTGHSYSYAVTKAPTTGAAGTLTGTCSKCSGTTTVTLPKLNTSDYTYKIVTAATCTADGTGRYTWKTTTYGTFYFDATISKTGHSYSYAATKAPSTGATGTLTGTCSKCSGTTTVTLPKLNISDYTYKVVTAATCTADGIGRYTWKTTTYGTFYFDVTISKTGHSYSYAVTKAPSTGATGTLTGTCSKCSGTTTVTLPKLNTSDYTYKVVTAATCTADGTGRYTWKTTTYGTFYFDVTIGKLGHSFTNYISNNDATTSADGTKTAKCDRCSETDTVVDEGSKLGENGWKQEANQWYYYEDGVKKTGWLQLDAWYYFNAHGVMQTGWQDINGVWYYFYNSGAMATGWCNVNGSYYYFGTSGAMKTGWLSQGGVWYYLKSSGAMATGWCSINGSYYYFSASGAMQTGWVQNGGVWYYLHPSGVMATGWVQDGGAWYYMRSSGAMVTGWLLLGDSWYYFHASGTMATGSVVINETIYHFDPNGVCLNP